MATYLHICPELIKFCPLSEQTHLISCPLCLRDGKTVEIKSLIIIIIIINLASGIEHDFRSPYVTFPTTVKPARVGHLRFRANMANLTYSQLPEYCATIYSS
jgi:hypothetical protein